MIEIRIDFPRRGFCLYVNGEAIGSVYSQYKFAALARQWLLAEVQS